MRKLIPFLFVAMTVGVFAQSATLMDTVTILSRTYYIGELPLFVDNDAGALDSVLIHISTNHKLNGRLLFAPAGLGRTYDIADTVHAGTWLTNADSVHGASWTYSMASLITGWHALLKADSTVKALRYYVFFRTAASGNALTSQAKKFKVQYQVFPNRYGGEYVKVKDTTIIPATGYLKGLDIPLRWAGGRAIDSVKLYVGANHLFNANLTVAPYGGYRTPDINDSTSTGPGIVTVADSVHGGGTTFAFREIERWFGGYDLPPRMFLFVTTLADGNALASQGKKFYIRIVIYYHALD